MRGFVVTFDDVTELAAAQRRAAWADIARRIAHEIKNPLTPIQLAAERLRRKYQDEVKTDPDVFADCTDTIIRQVGEIDRLISEFSNFARMPAPEFRSEDITELARRALFMQQVRLPTITNYQTLLTLFAAMPGKLDRRSQIFCKMPHRRSRTGTIGVHQQFGFQQSKPIKVWRSPLPITVPVYRLKFVTNLSNLMLRRGTRELGLACRSWRKY